MVNSKKIDFNNVIDKEVVGIDGLDLGKVVETGDTFIVTQRGLIDKKRYHLPISSVETFDGEVLNLRINDNDLKSYEQFEKSNFEGYSSFKSSDMSNELQTTIPLVDEKLDITKKIRTEDVKIVKEPIKRTTGEQINLSYDNVMLIKRPIKWDNNLYKDKAGNSVPQDNYSANSIFKEGNDTTPSGKTEMVIVLEREEPVITKRSFVREEIIVKKESMFETKTIAEDLIHEQIKYDDDNIASKVESRN